MTKLRVAFQNNTADGGLFVTPMWFGLHDGQFDLFNVGDEARESLERIAEDGDFSVVNAELTGQQVDSLVGEVFAPVASSGEPPLFNPGEVAGAIVDDVDVSSHAYLNYAAMILPSNDAFVANANALRLFDDNGNFVGAQNVDIMGTNVYDSGTEENREFDAVFQGDLAGVEEDNVVHRHEGFRGSIGNPLENGETADILGQHNAFGLLNDPVAADFTRDNYDLGTLHVNEVKEFTASDNGDTMVGDEADDIMTGGAGNDEFSGNDGWDILSGGAGDDQLSGGEGNDVLDGGTGNDWLDGGDGRDTVILTGSSDDYTFTRVENNAVRATHSDGSYDVISAVEYIQFNGDSGSSTVLLEGLVEEGALNEIVGTPGDDVLNGTDGNDLIIGLAGNDTLNGGDGDDSLLGDDGNDNLMGGDGNDSLQGGEGDDQLIGNAGNDFLNGGAGNDILRGFVGDDVALGGEGDDFISGGDGSDSLLGEAGNDDLRGQLGVDYLSGGDGDDNLQGGEGNDFLFGEAGNDVLRGGADDDVMLGGDDNDLLFGEAGDDGILGEAGDDAIDGGEGNDFISGGEGNDQMWGSAGNDQLYGDAGNDVLFGGEGDDFLNGGDGVDYLVAGAGTDGVVAGAGADLLQLETDAGLIFWSDFEDGVDRIDATFLGNEAEVWPDVTIFDADNGAGTWIQYQNTSILLEGISAEDIDINDFLIERTASTDESQNDAANLPEDDNLVTLPIEPGDTEDDMVELVDYVEDAPMG